MIQNSIKYEQLAACLLQLGQHEELQKLTISQKNNGFNINYFLSLSFAQRNELDKAIQCLRNNLKDMNRHAPSRQLFFDLLIFKANQLIKNKQFVGTTAILEEAVKIAKSFSIEHSKLVWIQNIIPIFYINSGQREKAATFWENKLKEQYNDYLIIHNLAILNYWWAIEEEKKLIDHDKQFITDKKRKLLDKLWINAIVYWILLINTPEYLEYLKNEKEKIWNSTISQDDMTKLKNYIIENRLIKLFNYYKDQYSQKQSLEDSMRHKNYLSILSLEKKSSVYLTKIKKNLKEWEKLYLQINKENTINNIDLLNLNGGLYFFSRFALLDPIQKILNNLHALYPKNEKLHILRILFTNIPLARLYILAESPDSSQEALSGWKNLSKNEQKSIFGIYLYVYMNYQYGKEVLDMKSIFDAFSYWEKSLEYLSKNEFIEMAQKGYFEFAFNSLTNLVKNQIVEACKTKIKIFNNSDKIDTAISILKEAIKLTKNQDCKELLVSFYCDKGMDELNKKNYNKAIDFFEEALNIIPDYKRAKEGIATTYNNEGVASKDIDRMIRLLEKAKSYDSNSEIILENLASAYNSKAVELLNLLTNYYSERKLKSAINFLKKGILLLNSQLTDQGLMSLGLVSDYDFKRQLSKLPKGIYRTMLDNLHLALQVYYRSQRNPYY